MPTFEDNVTKFFKQADTDHNNFLSAKELYKVLLDSGFGGTAYDAQCWCDSIDTNKDKKITLEELLCQLSKRDPKSVEETELRAKFKEFDTDGSGFITSDELKAVLTKFGNKGNAEKYISTIDHNSDGKISIEEFIKLWKEG